MKYRIPLWLGWMPILAAGAVAAREPQPMAINVFADLHHTGMLSGPLAASPTAANEFGIAVPLPPSCAERDALPARVAGGEDVAERLGRLRVETSGGAGAIVVSISCEENRRCLRLFHKVDGVWRRAAPKEGESWTLTPDKAGILEVGVGVVLPVPKPRTIEPAWPRTFAVEISPAVPGGNRFRVPFRVAPYLIPSALEPVEELLIVSQPATADSVKAVQRFAATTPLKLYPLVADKRCDQWMQDTIEPGLFPFPTADSTRQARAVLAGIRKGSRRSAAGLDLQVAERLRGREVVTVVPVIPRKKSRWIDWYGNLEVTPPFTDRHGRHFPYGRVITGRQIELAMHPAVMKFIQAQEMQWPPIEVDVSWLMIGHVDEVVSFVPAKTKTGFKVLMPSPEAAREMLDTLLKEGLGDAVVFAETDDETTVGELREAIAASDENLEIEDTIAQIREHLKAEMNLDNADFVMVPALFESGVAVIPNPVNSVVVNRHLLVPEPPAPCTMGRIASKRRFAMCSRRATCAWFSSIPGMGTTRRAVRSTAERTRFDGCVTRRGGCMWRIRAMR